MLLRRVVVPSSGLRAASLLSRAAAASPSSLSAVAPAAPAVSKPLAQRLRPRISSAPPTALRAFSAPPASCFSTSAPAFEAAGEGEGEGEAADASQCPLLEPPWQLIDLNPRERQAWADHGPALLDFPPLSKERERALERIELRRKIAKGFEERLGPEWYVLLLLSLSLSLSPSLLAYSTLSTLCSFSRSTKRTSRMIAHNQHRIGTPT